MANQNNQIVPRVPRIAVPGAIALGHAAYNALNQPAYNPFWDHLGREFRRGAIREGKRVYNKYFNSSNTTHTNSTQRSSYRVPNQMSGSKPMYGPVHGRNPYSGSARRASRKRPYYGGGYSKGNAKPLPGKSTTKGGVKAKPARAKSSIALSASVNKLQAEVKRLKSTSDESLGTMKYRKFQMGRQECNYQEQSVEFYAGNTNPNLRDIMDQLRTYDTTTSTYVTAPPSAGQQNSINVDSYTCKFRARNTARGNVHCTIYVVEARDNTNDTPLVTWNNSLPDVYQGNPLQPPTTNALGVYPSDSDLVNNLWRTKVLYKGNLGPGQQVEVAHTAKNFKYNPPVDTNTFEVSQKSFGFLVILKGGLCIDNSGGVNQGNVNIQDCQIAYSLETSATVKYDSLRRTRYVVIDNPTYVAAPITDGQSTYPQQPYQLTANPIV